MQAISLHELLTQLKLCTRAKDLERGRRLHEQACETGLHLHIYAANTLINMYSKCGSTSEALRTFEFIPERDPVSWNALLTGFVDNHEPTLALHYFTCMLNQQTCVPTARTFLAALKAVTQTDVYDPFNVLETGMAVHREAAELGYDRRDVFVGSSLVDMYTKCGSLVDAVSVFERMKFRNVVTWTALMLGYVEYGKEQEALVLFSRLQTESGYVANSRTFAVVLKACTGLAVKEEGRELQGVVVKLESLEKGMAIHSQVKRDRACSMDLYVLNTLVDLYGKCGSLQDACNVFDIIKIPNVISWTMLMSGYVENGHCELALKCFISMQREGCVPDSRAYALVLKSCACLAEKEAPTELEQRLVKMRSFETGLLLHSQASAQGCCDSYVRSTLVDMYAKCLSMEDSQRQFDMLQTPDVVSWTSLMLGHVSVGDKDSALEAFKDMRAQGACEPNALTYGALLKACSGLVQSCRVVHGEICRMGLDSDELLLTCLLDAYAKSDGLTDAQLVFESKNSWEVPAWNMLLAGYSFQGDTENTFRVFHRMQSEDRKSNPVTFIYLLTACSHGGMVKEAKRLFEMMKRCGVSPETDHYVCMVDMLGRANEVEEAVKVVESMSLRRSSVIWMAVLDSCSKTRNETVGRLAFQRLAELNRTTAEGRGEEMVRM